MIENCHKDGQSRAPFSTFCFKAPFFHLFVLTFIFVALIPNVFAGQETAGVNKNNKSIQTDSDKTANDNRYQPNASECGATNRNETVGAEKSDKTNLIENTNNIQKITHFSCQISAQQVHEAWSKRNILLIDVRRENEFEKFRIPDALNLAPFSIKTKSYLKDKHIVLVNEGRYLTQLESVCEELKTKGFQKVNVLSGGIYGWHQAGFPVYGEKIELSRLNKISPSEWISALHEREWNYIDLDNSLKSVDNIIHFPSIIEYEPNDKRALISAVNQVNKSYNPRVLSGFLVVSNNGDDYKSVERLLRMSDAKNIFFLSGGVTEFKRYLKTHASLISRLARGFKEPHRCSG